MSCLSHLVRTQRFVDELEAQEEALSWDDPTPDPVEEVAFENVGFSYNESEEAVLRGIPFDAQTGEFMGSWASSGRTGRPSCRC